MEKDLGLGVILFVTPVGGILLFHFPPRFDIEKYLFGSANMEDVIHGF
jgi:hypothetical protein